MSNVALNPDYLPPKARELAQLIGLPGLLALVDHHGGRRLKIPAAARETHTLHELLGAEAFTALINDYGGDEIDIPLLHSAKRQLIWADIQQRRANGETVASLAGEYQMTERGIYKIQRRGDADDQQVDFEF
ncbi:MAG: Mor transcription activator family protein [Candidatus Sedimenticola sp. (ex Thyasira tokunagai)]